MSLTRCLMMSGLIFLCGTMLSTDAVRAQENEDQAVEAAERWLGLVDAGDYGASWDGAAAVFKTAVTREGWETSLNSVRQPLGNVGSRDLVSANYTTELPNAPAGEYVVIEMQTSFENRPTAVETVVCMRQSDGSWKVAGYFIR